MSDSSKRLISSSSKIRIFSLLAGTLFGFILIVSGVSNYNVIVDMFLFREFHMYGVLAVSVGISFVVTQVLKYTRWKAVFTGEQIAYDRLQPTKSHIIGGLLCGVGWGLTGACPGPALAQVGFGTLSGIFTVCGIFLGVYVYGRNRE